ncbi:MAG: MATE family efflux transporter [Bacteroidota bacterium]
MSATGHSRARNFIAGVFSGYVLMFATVAVGLWLTPFTLRFLNREEYAIFALMSDVLMWLGLLDLGISAGLRAQAAQLTGRPDQERLNRLASTAFYAQNIVVLAVIVIGGVLALGFPRFFVVRPDLHDQSIYLMVLMVGAVAMSLGTQTFSALLIANQQIHVDNAFGLLNIVIRTVLTVVLLESGWGLYSLGVANLAAKATSSSLAVVRTFRLLPELQIRRSLATWEVLKSIGNLGVWFSLGGLAGIMISGLSRIVTAKMVSMEVVTTLTLTGRLYSFSGGLILLMTDTARPMLGQLLGQKKMGDVLRIYRQLFALSVGCAIVLALAIWAGNGPFVTAWVGEINYGGAAMDFALATNFIISFWVRPNRSVLAAALIVRPQAVSQIVEGALNLGLSIILARPFGVFGIVLATTIASLLSSAWYLPYRTAKMFNLTFMKFLWTDVSKLLILAACLSPVAYGARVIAFQTSGFVGAAVGAALAGVAGLTMLWFIVFDAGLRIYIRENLVKVRQSVFQF